MDDSSDIHGEVISGLKQVASQTKSTLFGEVRKLGRSAGSHITGKSSSVADEGKRGQTFQSGPLSLMGELKRFGQTATSQITGRKLTPLELSELAKRDEELSKNDADAVRAKIQRIYHEYEEKRRKQRQVEFEQQKTQEQQVKQQAAQAAKKKQQKFVNPQIAKARAEIGKNWGAE